MTPNRELKITGTAAALFAAALLLAAGCMNAGGGAAKRSTRTFNRDPDPGGRFHKLAAGAKRTAHAAGFEGSVGTFDELWVIEKPGRAVLRDPAASGPRAGQLSVLEGSRTTPLPLERTDVSARITAFLSSVKVRQRFTNGHKRRMPAVYSFPLPLDAAVTDFLMTIGTRRIRGIVRERRDAWRIYEAARRQGFTAALLTQKRPGLFSSNIASIRPGKSIDVEISYFAPLRHSGGEFEFAFPMTAAPPPGLPREKRSGKDIALSLQIEAGAPIEKIYSRSHVVEVKKPSASRASVRLAPAGEIPNRDFVLRYRLAGKRMKAALLIHRGPRGDYFALLLCPPDSAAELPRVKREVFFILDGSGSMRRGALELGKRTLAGCLASLSADDTFRLLTLAGKGEAGGKLTAANPAAIRKATEELALVRPDGFAALTPALSSVLEQSTDTERRRVICLLTDGHLADEGKALAALRKKSSGALLYACGLGSEPNRRLLESVATSGSGALSFLTDANSVEHFAKTFATSSARPAMTDIRVEWGGMKVEGVYPRKIADLVVGRPLLIVGRFGGSGKRTVKVHGKTGGRKVSCSIDVDLDAAGSAHPEIEKLWARWRIKELHSREALRPGRELRNSITETALRHGMVSRYTSIMIVDAKSTD